MAFTKKRIGALLATAMIGAGLSMAVPASANAATASPNLCSGSPLVLITSGGSDSFGCGTHFGNWWGTSSIYSGGHDYASVMLNDNGSDYNISINQMNTWFSPRSSSDDAVEVWIGR
ncbi:hypothetical protein P3T37_003683 [Kitasatospora sp. MAA4]|uniref:hypothetical protein n=1 Tax=Kitasatospora sp. MAA4 TaxID=3035093 RepID=UPI002473ED94|nr:hypothetical protein [Kitasatospora sp. MAA4]MDH6134281.1 hypothetical protein [Kitasatospora sp. MAA4]